MRNFAGADASYLDVAVTIGEGNHLSYAESLQLQRTRRILRYRDTGLVAIRRWTQMEMSPYIRRAQQVITAIGGDAHQVISLAEELKNHFHLCRKQGMTPQLAMQSVNRTCRRIEQGAAKPQ